MKNIKTTEFGQAKKPSFVAAETAQAVVKWIPGLCLVDFVFVSSGSVVSFDGNYFPL
jgi:hypothetical protein